MLDPAIATLLKEDRRYPLEAYIFVFEALHFAQNVLGWARKARASPAAAGRRKKIRAAAARHRPGTVPGHPPVRPGAIRLHGQARAGQLGVHSTGDFGEIVFNLIRIGRMGKTPHDRREDFDDVYDFDSAFREQFRIVMPETE